MFRKEPVNIGSRHPMKRIALALAAVGALGGAAAIMVPASGPADGAAAPIYGITIPPGYRDWQLISVAREDGSFNELRVQLGNDIAIKAYREGKLPFPDGAMIVALHWDDVASEENNKVFGRAQSFIAGSPRNIQFMGKDLQKYAATGGWGFRRILPMAGPPPRQCTKPASPATRPPKIAVLICPGRGLRMK